MKSINYNELLQELKELVENIRDSSTEDEETINKAIAVIKCKELLEGIKNNKIEIRKKI